MQNKIDVVERQSCLLHFADSANLQVNMGFFSHKCVACLTCSVLQRPPEAPQWSRHPPARGGSQSGVAPGRGVTHGVASQAAPQRHPNTGARVRS